MAVRHLEAASPCGNSGAVDVVAGDLRSREHLQLAVDGVAAIHHICPNMRADEVSIAQLVVRSAQIAGCRRFVYHSVLHPQTEEMPHHWQKLRVEELLLRSGLDVTILQPAAYMQNLLAYWPAIARRRRAAHALRACDACLSLVDLEDVATVAAEVLTDDRHTGATYELVGTAPLDQHAVAALCTAVLGRPVAPRSSRAASGRERAGRGHGRVRNGQSAAHVPLLRRLRFRRQPICPHRDLPGRAPTTLRDFLERQLA